MVVELVTNIILIIAMTIYMKFFFSIEEPSTRRILIGYSFFICSYFLFSMFHEAINPFLRFIFTYFSVYLFTYYFFCKGFLKTAVVSLTFCILEILFELLVISMISIPYFITNTNIIVLMNKILLLIGVIGVVFCLERKYYWTLIVTFTTLTFFTIYNLYTNSEIIPFLNHSINNSHWLVILVLSFCLLIFLAHFLSLLKEFEKTRKINKVIQKQLDFYGKYSSNYVKQKEYEKMLLHDFKQHMIYLREVGKECNISHLREYLASISSDFFSRKERFNEISGNLVVDIILNHYKNLAEEAKIKLNIEAEIPKDIEYDPSDISVLLGNLLENSYEANLKDDITEKFIDVKIKYKKSVLFIWIQNSFDGKNLKVNNGKFLTNKQDKDWHGIGIESIKEIVKKYNGECQFQTKYNRFQVKIFM